MSLTPDQDRAIHHHADNLIVVAGAGSGKTFVLVERYLALLERNPGWSLNALVAITFTQKAAQEMRDRVRQHLQQRVDDAADADARALGEPARRDGQRPHRHHSRLVRVDPAGERRRSGRRSRLRGAGRDRGARAARRRASTTPSARSKPDDPVLELFAEYGERAAAGGSQAAGGARVRPAPGDLFTAWLDQWVTDARTRICSVSCDWCAASAFRQLVVWLPDGDKLAAIWATCADLLARVRDERDRRRAAGGARTS